MKLYDIFVLMLGIELHRNNLRNALLFHRHSIDRLSGSNRTLVMRNNDELRVFRELFEQRGKTTNIRFIERRIQFVEQTERARFHKIDSEEQTNRRHGTLTTRKQRHALKTSAWRLRHDLDAAL